MTQQLTMLNLFKRLLCSHTWTHHRNIYGDEINHLDARSEWHCAKCGAYQLRPDLYDESNPLGKNNQ